MKLHHFLNTSLTKPSALMLNQTITKGERIRLDLPYFSLIPELLKVVDFFLIYEVPASDIEVTAQRTDRARMARVIYCSFVPS